jgi:glutamyl-Q tRNA(Asp) synthetase
MGTSDSGNKLASTSRYRGRFAPSPTGPLHFGSLVAAVGSFLQARTSGGQWLIRIEDIDPPREVAGAANAQLETLARFGMMPDEPVSYQSKSDKRHREALTRLRRDGHAFGCACTRRDLPDTGIYPGTCRKGLPPGATERSVRFRVSGNPVEVLDRVFGRTEYNLVHAGGDFVIRRADGLIAYQLAVVVDDIAAGVTEVVRGSDLLDSSARQQCLYEALGARTPDWMHLPLCVDRFGRKLSKSGASDPVERLPPANALRLALTALGHAPPGGRRGLASLWQWGLSEWQPERVPTEPFEIT